MVGWRSESDGLSAIAEIVTDPPSPEGLGFGGFEQIKQSVKYVPALSESTGQEEFSILQPRCIT